MPKLTTAVTATTTTEVALKPAVRRKLLTELHAYAALKTELDAIEAAMAAHKTTIGELRAATGEGSLTIEGFKITEVRGQSSKLDPKKLLAQGVTMAQIEMATVTTPKRPYEKITLPGAAPREED